MNWSRVIGVVTCAGIWMIVDALLGKEPDPGLALLAGFVAAWMNEKS